MSPSLPRGRYQGVLQILQFNSPKYLAAVAAVLAAASAWPFFGPAGRMAALLVVTPALFWAISSLIVSHHVYDRSSLYDFRQIARLLKRAPRRWVNIHSGWDETSDLLHRAFPEASGQVADIFDPRWMTESSIRRARRLSHSAIPATPGRYNALPFPSASFDTAFLIFAAHELRRHQQRVCLFRETARVLGPGGELVLVEHARDWRNFLAFGPGFLHFFSPRAWRHAALQAGFNLEAEVTMATFVHIYLLRKNP